MPAIRIILTAVALCTAAGCSKPSVVRNGPIDALGVAIDYINSHHPMGTFHGALLHYSVIDKGEVWKTEIGPANSIGGGIIVEVRKRDMKVIGELRTQ